MKISREQIEQSALIHYLVEILKNEGDQENFNRQYLILMNDMNREFGANPIFTLDAHVTTEQASDISGLHPYIFEYLLKNWKRIMPMFRDLKLPVKTSMKNSANNTLKIRLVWWVMMIARETLKTQEKSFES